jgi:hypothetical protein
VDLTFAFILLLLKNVFNFFWLIGIKISKFISFKTFKALKYNYALNYIWSKLSNTFIV